MSARTAPRVSPHEAARLMRDEGYAYLDVRTPEEFALGHPAGAWNVPSHLQAPHGRSENGEFVRVVLATFAHDEKLVVGCQTGQRSQRACELLADSQLQLVEQRAGFGGVRDSFGKLSERGWSALGLPVAHEPLPGHDYAALLARARR
jgi:rhodanese-related sulfurtransferase